METSAMESIIRENRACHARLENLVARLTDAELTRPLGSGWTAAAVLAHLAFWDARAALLIERWMREGIGPSPADVDIINDAARELCLAIPPRAAADLAVRKSREVNRAIQNLSPEMMENVHTAGNPVHLERWKHKRTHLDEVEGALGKA